MIVGLKHCSAHNWYESYLWYYDIGNIPDAAKSGMTRINIIGNERKNIFFTFNLNYMILNVRSMKATDAISWFIILWTNAAASKQIFGLRTIWTKAANATNAIFHCTRRSNSENANTFAIYICATFSIWRLNQNFRARFSCAVKAADAIWRFSA